jgi:hypothetical protein
MKPRYRRLAISIVMNAIKRQVETGSWLNCFPFERLGNTLSALEYRTGIAMRYDLAPPNLPKHCSLYV